MIPRTSVIPPGGHHFVEKHGETEVRVDGGSYDEVAEKLLKYRVANGLVLGQPKDEVIAYVCGKWPHFCHDSPVVGPSAVGHRPSFTVEVMQWLQRLWNRQALVPQPLVGDAEANRRAAICRECPMQKDWSDYGCGSCVDQVRRQSLVFRAGREVSNHKKVTGCIALGQENHAACWASVGSLPEPTEEQASRLPNACWRRR